MMRATMARVWSLFASVVGAFLVAMALTFAWMMCAPRDPGGMLCDDATPLRSVGAMLRGKSEEGCAWHNQPIIETAVFRARRVAPEP